MDIKQCVQPSKTYNSGRRVSDLDLVTIIVPVFNVAAYLDMCVDSLIGQTYPNLEILLIDDGSTDDSGLKCESYAKKDDRVVVVHQSNKGLSAARNTGTKIASGTWIVFVDSDDAVVPFFVETLLFVAKRYNVSLVCANHCLFSNCLPDSSESASRKDVYCSISGSSAACEMFSLGAVYPSAWGKMALADIWKHYLFPEGRRFEDLPVVWKVLSGCDSVGIVKTPLYYYRKRHGSIVSTPSESSLQDLMTTINQVEVEVAANSAAEYYKIPVHFLLSVECCRLYRNCLKQNSNSMIQREGKRFAIKYVRKNILDAIRNKKASVIQRMRVLMFAIAPTASTLLADKLIGYMRNDLDV